MNGEALPLVSVLTPVYNGEKYLAECIESVLAQTYQNWDYTIVNNCSTDSSMQIAQRYAAKDPRIRIQQNQQFLRVISNHNVAFRQVSPAAKYCKMVFADDWIFPECLERTVALGEENPQVGVVGAYTLQGTQVTCTGLPYPSRVVSGREICRRHFLDRLYVFGSANSVLYRADLVRSHDPFYDESNIHADTEACFILLKKSDFGFVHQVLTFTRVREESLTALSNDLQTDLAALLHALLAHGPDYLTRQELDGCVASHLSCYYEYLGKSMIFGREKTFWDYHKKKLTEEGFTFSRSRFARALLATVCDAALNPKDTIQRLLNRYRQPKERKHNRQSKETSASLS